MFNDFACYLINKKPGLLENSLLPLHLDPGFTPVEETQLVRTVNGLVFGLDNPDLLAYRTLSVVAMLKTTFPEVLTQYDTRFDYLDTFIWKPSLYESIVPPNVTLSDIAGIFEAPLRTLLTANYSGGTWTFYDNDELVPAEFRDNVYWLPSVGKKIRIDGTSETRLTLDIRSLPRRPFVKIIDTMLSQQEEFYVDFFRETPERRQQFYTVTDSVYKFGVMMSAYYSQIRNV